MSVAFELGFNIGDRIEIEGDGKTETAVIAATPRNWTIVVTNGLTNAFEKGATAVVVQESSCEVEWNGAGRRLSSGCKVECDDASPEECLGKTCCEL